MAHQNQQMFCIKVKKLYPEFFKNVSVLDVGSLDIIGNNRSLFTDSEYIGIDLGEGRNVDVVCVIEDYQPNRQFDTIISTEMLEHCFNWEDALLRMYELLKSGGLFLLTCAGEGRGEHGTTEHDAWASPFTNDHYFNFSNQDFASIIEPKMFQTYHLHQDILAHDLQFYGIKK